MIADAGNIEDGESEVETDPVTMLLSNTNLQATFQLLSNIERNGNLTVRNVAALILWSQPNIILAQNQPSEFTFTTSSGSTTPFYIVQFISNDEIVVVRKFILL